jgi:hypothetical protein
MEIDGKDFHEFLESGTRSVVFDRVVDVAHRRLSGNRSPSTVATELQAR